MEKEEILYEKIKSLVDAGLDPYPTSCKRTHEIIQYHDDFERVQETQEVASLAGRIVSMRKHGRLAFVDINDGTGSVQLIHEAEVNKERFDIFNTHIGTGDFILVEGTAKVTKTGINSMKINSWKLLVKTIKPIPDEWYGLKNEEERYRKRYLDMMLNPSVIDNARKRSLFWNTIRTYMLQRDFVEVETPILETHPSGARARQFTSHHNALDIDVFLRISPELWHKKLIIGGLPKVFEIGRVFRNEGMSPEHAQDYTAFEFYEAYTSAEDRIEFVVDLLRHAAKETFGTLEFEIRKHAISLANPWPVLVFSELIEQNFSFNLKTDSTEKLTDICFQLDRSGSRTTRQQMIELLWKETQSRLINPCFVTKVPYFFAPLGKRTKADPLLMDEYKIVIAGHDMGHFFNELNDPLDQLNRLREQQKNKNGDFDDPSDLTDFEHIEALGYGMPPTFGLGLSERLFAFLADTTIREAQLFPIMRPLH